ncbi:hypothetical protein VP01_342g2 [Puccinia sorghi]|uniref:Uncharacterized protein n=1 Tax=Puccinia sorghi TaxID=27349 RepID=A0A0L6UWH8_9BASI|nr:hypothetical protein VP01_342g2 [Puccinia sorghi]
MEHSVTASPKHCSPLWYQGGRETQIQAVRWRDTDTLVEQKHFLKLNGTRWSELNHLPYWDPLRNIAFGVMHNWYKGVLQQHWRVCWAFKHDPLKQLSHNDQLDALEDNVSKENEARSEFQDSALLHIKKALPSIIFPRVCTVTVHQILVGVTTEASWEFLNVNCRKLSKFFLQWHVIFSTYLPLSLIDFFVKNPAYCGS